jgi:hypothetical protein
MSAQASKPRLRSGVHVQYIRLTALNRMLLCSDDNATKYPIVAHCAPCSGLLGCGLYGPQNTILIKQNFVTGSIVRFTHTSGAQMGRRKAIPSLLLDQRFICNCRPSWRLAMRPSELETTLVAVERSRCSCRASWFLPSHALPSNRAPGHAASAQEVRSAGCLSAQQLVETGVCCSLRLIPEAAATALVACTRRRINMPDESGLAGVNLAWC